MGQRVQQSCVLVLDVCYLCTSFSVFIIVYVCCCCVFFCFFFFFFSFFVYMFFCVYPSFFFHGKGLSLLFCIFSCNSSLLLFSNHVCWYWMYVTCVQVSQFLLLCMSVVVVFFFCFFFFFFSFFVYMFFCVYPSFFFHGKGLSLLFCIFSCNSCPFLSHLFFFVVYLWCICLVIIVNKLEVW